VNLIKKLNTELIEARNTFLSLTVKLLAEAGLRVSENPIVNILSLIAYGFPLSVTLTYLATHFPKLLTFKIPSLISGNFFLAALPFISLATAFPTGIITLKMLALTRGRRVKREVKYLIIAESIIAQGDPNLFEDFCALHMWKDVFPSLQKEGMMISALRKIFTIPETVRVYIKLLKCSWVRELLQDYLFALGLGSVKEWLQVKGREITDEIRTGAKAALEGRISISLITAILLGYTPPLIVALSSLLGKEIVAQALLLTILAIPLAFIVTPQYPMHMKLIYRANMKILFIIISLLLALLVLRIEGIIALRETLFITSTALVVYGVISLHNEVRGFREIKSLVGLLNILHETPLSRTASLSIVKEALLHSPEKTWRAIGEELTLVTLPKSMARLRAWVSRFTVYVLMKGLEYGCLNRESLAKLSCLISESLHDLKVALASNLVVGSLAVALPFILTSLTSFTSPDLFLKTYTFISTMGYGFYASYVLFNNVSNTIIPGIVGLELAFLVNPG
jgi:hypothetical protein